MKTLQPSIASSVREVEHGRAVGHAANAGGSGLDVGEFEHGGWAGVGESTGPILPGGLVISGARSMFETRPGEACADEAMTAFPAPPPGTRDRHVIHSSIGREPSCPLTSRSPTSPTRAHAPSRTHRNVSKPSRRWPKARASTVKSVHWTTGAYDIVLVTEGAEDALMALNLKMATLGNVRTQTLRGFSITEMRKLVSTLK